MKKLRLEKTHFLIAIYIILIATELFFYVPYHSIQVFLSKQNVPHTEIIGSGYTTMADITRDDTYIEKNKNISDVGKKVNTSQIFINVSITTVLAVAIYFLLPKKEKKIVEENVPIPVLDVDSLTFADEETIKQVQEEYARQMVEYIKSFV